MDITQKHRPQKKFCNRSDMTQNFATLSEVHGPAALSTKYLPTIPKPLLSCLPFSNETQEGYQ